MINLLNFKKKKINQTANDLFGRCGILAALYSEQDKDLVLFFKKKKYMTEFSLVSFSVQTEIGQGANQSKFDKTSTF